jgi:hypothetical protein
MDWLGWRSAAGLVVAASYQLPAGVESDATHLANLILGGTHKDIVAAQKFAKDHPELEGVFQSCGIWRSDWSMRRITPSSFNGELTRPGVNIIPLVWRE